MPFDLSISWSGVWDVVRAVLEFSLIFFFIYKILYYMRGTRSLYVLVGIIGASLIFRVISGVMELEVIKWLLDKALELLAFASIVIFQQELRRAFAQLGSYTFGRDKRKQATIHELMTAVNAMASRKIGALIVIERRIKIGGIERDAVKLDCKLSALLLQSIFYPNSPLHDGAVIVREDTIVAARAILPLSRDANISRTMGTRHRAALGITEEADCVVLVVSEETGGISIACQGEIKRELSSKDMEEELNNLLTTDGGMSDELGNQDEKEGEIDFHGDSDPDSQPQAGDEK